MRVGVYVDGFNLYYGGRAMFGKGTAGWKWLDLRLLAQRLITTRSQWSGATVERVVFCTARIDGSGNPTARIDQDIYQRALDASGAADHVEHGYYVRGSSKGLWRDAPAARTSSTSTATAHRFQQAGRRSSWGSPNARRRVPM